MRPASSQAEIFAAVRAAVLRSSGKVILFALGAVFDDELGAIPGYCQPSLTDLAGWTGLHRASVKRWANRLEGRWILRDRPDPAAARRLHITTKYGLLVPDELGAPGAQAGRSRYPSLGAPGAGAGRSGDRKLGARGATSDDDFRTSTAREEHDYDGLAGVVIEELGRAGHTVPRDQAAEIARRVLAGTKIRTTPERYLRGALQKTPGKWAPAAVPRHPPVPRTEPRTLSQDEIRDIIRRESNGKV